MTRPLLVLVCMASLLGAAAQAGPRHPVQSEDRVGGRLAEALVAWEHHDLKTLQQVAANAQALVRGDLASGSWRIQLHAAPGARADDLDLRDLPAVGGEVADIGLDLADIWLPLRAVQGWVARHPEVAFAQLPWRPAPTLGPKMSEGATELRTPEVLCLGADGTGTTVAVLDEGFDHLGDAVKAGEVPNLKGSALDGGGAHGTMCCEVVADTAPGAQILPTRTETMAAMQAFAKLIGLKGNPQKVTLVSHSAIWMGMSFGQHEGKACEVTDLVRSAGVAWVNAAGNSGGGSFYRAPFVDKDKSGYQDFEPGEDKLYFNVWHGKIQMTLDWDDYQNRKVNLDLELWLKKDGTWTKVQESVQKQGNFVPPLEQVVVEDAPGGLYALKVKAIGKVPEGMALRIVSMGYGNGAFSVWHQNGNVYDPASCKGVLTVGAIYHGNYEKGPLESYSSYGPTPDGRQKPEVMAPTGVSTTQGAFYGTSAACPHAAGALAAWAGATGKSAEELVPLMREQAIAMGEAHPDTRYGWGRVVLPPVSLGYDCTVTSLPGTATCTTACGSVGTHQCGAKCRYTQCAPPAETCNGKDDDCDGKTDLTADGKWVSGCAKPAPDAVGDTAKKLPDSGGSDVAAIASADGHASDDIGASPAPPADSGCAVGVGGAAGVGVWTLFACAAWVVRRRRQSPATP